MTKQEITEKVNAILVEDFEIAEELLTPEASLKEDLEIDSLDFVDIVVLIDREFGFKPQAAELKNVKTLQSVNEVVGSGDIKIHYDNSGNVESTIVGSGDITLSGQVKRSTYEIRGSGDMNTGNLIVKN